MKKLIFIPALFLSVITFGQQVDTLLGFNGRLIRDTAITIASNYLTTPTTTSLSFDSSQVVTNVVLNGTGDSVYIFKGIAKVGVIKLGSGGSSTPWITSGSNIYYNAGNVGIKTTNPVVPFHVNSIMGVGDSVTAANSIRQLSVVGSGAGLRLHRISSNIQTAAPSIDLVHSKPNMPIDQLWDMYVDSIGISIRDRIGPQANPTPDSTRFTIAQKTGNLILGIDRTDYPSSSLSLNNPTRGFLMNRGTTTQRNSIVSPPAGLQYYNTTTSKPEYWDGTVWITPNSNGNLLTYPSSSGINRDFKIFNNNSTADNLSIATVYPSSGTNVGSFLNIIPKGTGFSGSSKSQISIYNTDAVSDPSSYEALLIRAAGSEYLFGSVASNGSVTARPIRLYTSNNTNQIYMQTDGKVGIGRIPTTDVFEVAGNINLPTAGNKIKIATGTNASVGTATLTAGAVTVSTTAALTGSLIYVSVKTAAGTQGFLSVPTIVNATSFTINSSSATETSSVNWWIIN